MKKINKYFNWYCILLLVIVLAFIIRSFLCGALISSAYSLALLIIILNFFQTILLKLSITHTFADNKILANKKSSKKNKKSNK